MREHRPSQGAEPKARAQAFARVAASRQSRGEIDGALTSYADAFGADPGDLSSLEDPAAIVAVRDAR